jgi:hypothetical protein
MNLSRAVTLSLLVGASAFVFSQARAASPDCSASRLEGRYNFNGQGTNLHYGIYDFDGSGKFSGKQTSVRQAHSAAHENLTGTYSLNADCTGTLVMDGQPGGTAHWDISVTSDGKNGRMVRTDAGTKGVRTFEHDE